ncbi:MAG: sugar ABC transporter permease YjfF [Lachnospiraceae bacterium]|nr:sugar ABC transporter permease YjfF [Lachnospiraceae bacterium]
MFKTKATATDTSFLLTITIVVFFVMYLLAIIFIGKGFTNAQTLLDMIGSNAGLIIVAVGMSVVMINGGIDISVGGVVSLVAMACADYLDHKGGNIFGAILIALGIGLAYGLVQGYLVAYLNIQPFIISLAGMFFARGMTTIISSQSFNVEHAAFVALKDTRIVVPFLGHYSKNGKFIPGEVEIGALIALFVVILFFYILKWTSIGRSFYAIGGNQQSALMLGINVKRTRFTAHMLCSFLAGVGGFVYFMHYGSGSALNASGMEMDAIASSIIGGTMLTGGVGNIIGTLFGVLSLSTIKKIVNTVGLGDAWWTGITVAAMLCIFLIVQSVVVGRKKK